MKTSKTTQRVISAVATALIAIACAGSLFAETGAAKSSGADSKSAQRWSVQVERVNPGELTMPDSFQMAIYENLLEDLQNAKAFSQVFREGDRKAQDSPNVLILKTTVEKYTAGSETKRAVTTVSGATKLTVRSQLVTRDGKVVMDSTVTGEVRFFGGNLRATHNLAGNIVKAVKEAQFPASDQPSAMLSQL